MSRAKIIVSSPARGIYFEGTLASGQTPKPGTCISEKSDGTWEAWNGAADGEQDLVAVLLEDSLQGNGVGTAYADGAHFFAYIPATGELLQMLLQNQSGTGDAFAITAKLIIDDGTGKLIATTGSPEMEPFKVKETTAALSADTLVLCQYTGH